MEEYNPEQMLNSLIAFDVEGLTNWIENINNYHSELIDFNWLGLAEVTSFRAINNLQLNQKLIALKWAKISIRIYDSLSISNHESCESFCLSSMTLRANFILEMGALENDMVLDPQKIIDWFQESAVLSHNEAVDKATKLRGQLSQEIAKKKSPEDFKSIIRESLELRKIKTRLGVIKILNDSPNVTLPSNVEKWLSIQAELL